jgi:Carboxypeptidase regulatory-like domain/Bacterial Ig-like domain
VLEMKFKLPIVMLVAVLLLTTVVVAISPTAIASSPTGEGSLVTGLVVDSSDVPIADAMVMLSNNTSTMDGGGMLGSMAMTDGNGTFVFQNVTAGSYNLDVSKDGYQDTSQNVSTASGQTTNTGVVLLEKSSSTGDHGIIVGFVKDQSGLPVPNVMVMLSNNMSTMDGSGMLGLMAMTDGNGTFVFQNMTNGVYNLSFSESSHDAVAIGNVNVLAGQTTSIGIVVMKKTVTANSPTGEDVALNTAISVSFSEALNESSVKVLVSGVNGTLTWSGNTGTFTPSSLLAYATRYSVIVGGNDQEGNAVIYTWSFTTIKDEGIVIGFVQDSNAHPIADAMVMLSNNLSTVDSSGMLGSMAMTDGNGTFSFHNVTAGSYHVSATVDGYDAVSRTVNVTAGQTTYTGELDLVKKSSGTDWVPIIVIAAVIGFAALLLAVFLIGRKKGEPSTPEKTDETIETAEGNKETQEEKK